MPSKTVAEKPKETKKTVKRLWHYLYEAKWLLLLSAVLMMASNLFSLVYPLLSGYAIDAIQPDYRKSCFSPSILLLRMDDCFLSLFSSVKLSDLIIDDPSESTCRPVHAQSDFQQNF